jgi:hypothetical protein
MKKIRPELKPAASGRPGIGILVVTNWERESLEFGAGAELCIQRNQDHRYLGERGQWTATQTWHQVSLSEEHIDTSVVLALDERLIDPLVENPQMTYQLQVRIGSEEAIGVLRIREGVLSSRAAGQSADPVTRVADAQRIVPPDHSVPPVAEPVEPVYEPVIESKQKPSRTGLWIALIAGLALVAAGLFAWKYYGSTAQPSVTPTAPTAAITTPPAAPAEPVPCSKEALAASKDDLLFIQTCLKTSPDSNQVLTVIATAKEAKRCDVVQRLYAFKGQSGDAKVALAYAREFDPATFVAGCLNAADKETAIYWYELVLSKEPDNTDVETRLEALRK